MALFNRNSGTEVPPSQVEYQQEPGRNWRVLVVYLILAFLVATLVVLSGRWVYQQLSDSSDVAEAPENSDQNQRSGAPDTAGNQSPAPSPPPSQGNSPQGAPNPSPSNLPNNGPGHVVALFIGTSFVAGGLHYIVTLRRLQQRT